MFSDEGLKLFDARNKVLFGQWEVGSCAPYYLHLHPIFTLIHYAVFAVFGIGYFQARVVTVGFGLGIVALLYFLMKRHYGQTSALLASVLCAFNYYFIMMSRTAVIEIPALFFILLAVYLFDSGSQKVFTYFWAGLAVVIAVCTKLYAIFLLPVLLLTLLLKKRWRAMVYFTIGLSSGLIFYALLWILLTDYPTLIDVITLNINMGRLEVVREHVQTILLTSGPQLMPTEPFGMKVLFRLLQSIARKLTYINHLFTLAPILFFFTGYYFILIAEKYKSARLAEIELISIFWLFFGGGLLIISKYTSFHHLIILMPAMVILSTIIIKTHFQESSNTLSPKETQPERARSTFKIDTLFQWLSLFILFFVIHQIFMSMLMLFFSGHIAKTPLVNPLAGFNAFAFLWFIIKNQAHSLIPLLPRIDAYEFWRIIAIIYGFLISAILVLMFHRTLKKPKNLSVIFIAGLSLFIIINAGRYFDYIRKPTFTQISAAKRLGELTRETDFVLGGQFLNLENRLHFSHHHEPNDLFINQATHVFKIVFHPLEGPQPDPQTLHHFKNYHFIESFVVCDRVYFLYSLKK